MPIGSSFYSQCREVLEPRSRLQSLGLQEEYEALEILLPEALRPPKPRRHTIAVGVLGAEQRETMLEQD